MIHAMLPGTHEWPRIPQCHCGAEWDRLTDSCDRRPAAFCVYCGKRIMIRALSRHTKRMHIIDHDDGKEDE